MKLKYYIRGAGVGILVTVIIMSIAFSGLEKKNKTEAASGTEQTESHGETVKSAAESEALKETEVVDRAEIATESVTETETESPALTDTEIETEKTTEGVTENDTESQDLDDAEVASDSDMNTDTDSTDSATHSITKIHTVSIIAGEDSYTIAKRLKELGIIDDAEAFNEYLEDENYDNVLRPGTYDIEEGLSYGDLAGIIMKR